MDNHYSTPVLGRLGSVSVLTRANMKSLAIDDESMTNDNEGSNNPMDMA